MLKGVRGGPPSRYLRSSAARPQHFSLAIIKRPSYPPSYDPRHVRELSTRYPASPSRYIPENFTSVDGEVFPFLFSASWRGSILGKLYPAALKSRCNGSPRVLYRLNSRLSEYDTPNPPETHFDV